MNGKGRKLLSATLANLAGLAAFFATWIIVCALGIQAGDFWLWLGLLFGWVPGIIAANVAERAWPLLLAVAAALVAFRLMS